MAYTYDDFVGAAQKAGLYDQFSQDDLTISQSNPEYGMSLLKLQQEVNSASTAEQKLLAQEAVNQLRSSYTPAVSTATGYSYGGQEAYDKALQGVTNTDAYSFDQATNPTYGMMKDQYLSDLNSAKNDLLGSTPVTGGSQLPSYAGTAAGQSGGYYGTRLNDSLPAVEQKAYSQYLQDLGMKADQFGVAAADQAFDYNKWLQEQNLDLSAKQQQFSNDLALHKTFGTDAPAMPDLSGGTVSEGVQYTYGKDDAYQKAMQDVLNQEEFSYDPASDPVYGSLRKSYLREGQRAGEDALARSSAGSMGVPSSYAVRMAADAQNGYLEQLMNGMGTTQDNAYSRYLQDFNNKLSVLGQLETDRELDYNKWLQNYQLEQQKKQQEFENALTMYNLSGLTPELAELLGVPYVEPSAEDNAHGSGYPSTIQGVVNSLYGGNHSAISNAALSQQQAADLANRLYQAAVAEAERKQYENERAAMLAGNKAAAPMLTQQQIAEADRLAKAAASKRNK